jgi:hypothetical protein
MKYTAELTIDLPRKKVVRLFDNTENTFLWQPGLRSLKLIQGSDRKEGARYLIVYEGRKEDLAVEETVVKRNLPDEFITVHRSRGVKNTIHHLFVENTPQQTMWRMVNQFRFSGMMRLMAPWMKQAFAGNTLLHMERFKRFAESTRTT